MPRTDLVIFDCDGVLVDSERVTTRLLAEVITEFGLPTTVEDAIARYKGTDLSVIVEHVGAQLGRPADELVEIYRGRMYAELGAACDACPGAPEALDAVEAAGLGWCVASNGPRKKIETTLRSSGLTNRVDPARVFSAYEVGVWKPEPGLFLAAAESLGASPERCVVVEDSRSGVVAGKAAGMRVIAYADITPAADLLDAGADAVIASMHELATALGIQTDRVGV
ncbi:MAG: hydrolase [Phycisphaeraceae bacterium]|nr:MAG: hydrolase [Phycisphaeraceae bacterium]